MVDSMRGSSPPHARHGTATRRLLEGATLAVALVGVAAWLGAGDLRAQQPSAPAAPPGTRTASPDPVPPPAPPQPASQPTPTTPGAQPTAPAPVGTVIGPGETINVAANPIPAPPRFQFKIAPNTPLKDLLPVPPPDRKLAGPVLSDDLARVPEVEFQAPLPKGRPVDKAMEKTAFTIAKINHVNGKRADGFLEALRGERPDLAGLPFAMGDACRTTGDRSRQFATEVATVRRALSSGQIAFVPGPGGTVSVVTTAGPSPAPTVVRAEDLGRPVSFWERYQAACAQEDQAQAKTDRAQCEHVTLARIAALMQVLAPESADVRLGLVKYLAAVSHAEATRALARLAIFDPDEEVRHTAVDALKVRRERDYTDVLVRGLRYPWPAVARRAADAVVKLERSDLVPQLVDLLDDPDPRAPAVQEVNHKKVQAVRELVRVNHHRSCLLCHAPGNTETVSPEALTAGVPVPGQPLPSPSQGYQATSPDLLVRIDVTYLRQDFSVRHPVADANPWPEMQRFDYLVRTRELTDDEADAYRRQLDAAGPDRPSPYQRAALAALRDLTGRDTAPTAAAWRRTLGLAAR
jgi:hypothetical protein